MRFFTLDQYSLRTVEVSQEEHQQWMMEALRRGWHSLRRTDFRAQLPGSTTSGGPVAFVSTIFTGVDMPFETMVFTNGRPRDNTQQRTGTFLDAMSVHDGVVAALDAELRVRHNRRYAHIEEWGTLVTYQRIFGEGGVLSALHQSDQQPDPQPQPPPDPSQRRIVL